MSEIDGAKFAGKWKLESSEKFDEYLKEVGLSKVTRLAACNIAVTQEFIINGKNVSVKSTSTFKDYELSFVLDEEFEEHTVDGRVFRTKIYEENGRMVHHQVPIKENDVESFIYRWIEDEKLHVLLVANGVESHRIFKRV